VTAIRHHLGDLLVVIVREIRRWRISGGLFIGLGVPLNFQAFTNDSLTMMYEGVRGALASDDTTKAQGGETRFRVRETPDWKQPAADLDSEMLKPGMFFEVIDWSEDQAQLPFE
jgi:hypothetical protein